MWNRVVSSNGVWHLFAPRRPPEYWRPLPNRGSDRTISNLLILCEGTSGSFLHADGTRDGTELGFLTF
jgi:hypothetical protein